MKNMTVEQAKNSPEEQIKDFIKWEFKDIIKASDDQKLAYYYWYLDYTSNKADQIRGIILDGQKKVYSEEE